MYFNLISSTEEDLKFQYFESKLKTIPLPKDSSGNILKGEKLVDFLNDWVNSQHEESIVIQDPKIGEKFDLVIPISGFDNVLIVPEPESE